MKLKKVLENELLFNIYLFHIINRKLKRIKMLNLNIVYFN